MITLESEVLQRHLTRFEEKTVLFSGYLQDDFFSRIPAKKVYVQSTYFDFVHRYGNASLHPSSLIPSSDLQTVHFSVDFYQPNDLIVYYWTKNKPESFFQLLFLLSQSPLGQNMLIVGQNRSGIRSVEKFLSPYGEVFKLDSARRCGLYGFHLTQIPHFAMSEFWQQYPLSEVGKIWALPGVFSSKELDQGSALLLESLRHQKIVGEVLDVGCGAGVIGAFLKHHYPHISLLMTDIHAMALTSAKRTLEENQLEGNVIASDVFSHVQGQFDFIVSNPPFHQGVQTAYRVAETLISQSQQYLKVGGELCLVANAFLPYAELFDQYFGKHQVLAQTSKFKVYYAKK